MTAMAGWTQGTLGGLCAIEIGGTPARNNPEYWDSAKDTGNRWVSIRDLNRRFVCETAEQISDLGVRNSNVKLQPKGTVLLSFKLSIGRVAFAGCDLYTNEAIAGLRSEALSSEFLFYGLQQWDLLQNVDQAIKGATLNKDKLKKIEFEYPESQVEQAKIAEVLSTLDRAIEQTEALIAKQQRIKTGLMQVLLTKGIDAHGNIRSEATHAFKDSPLGRIPVEWACQTAGALLSNGILSGIQDGNHGELHPKSSDFVPEGVPFVMASDIAGGEIDIGRAKRITEVQYQRLRIGFAQPRDVLLSHKASIGFVAIVPDDLLQIMLTPQVTYYRIGDIDRMNYRYLAQFFRSERFQEPLKSLAKQSTRDYIGILAQQDIHIAYPLSISEQVQIADILSSPDQVVMSHAVALNKLRELKTGVMHDLLTGERRVTPLLAQAATQ